MKAEWKEKLCGGEYILAMPIGALEDIARINPRLAELRAIMASGLWTLAELNAILTAALTHGKAPVTAKDVIAYEGLTRCQTLAVAALDWAFASEDERGNVRPGGATQPTDLTSPST